MTKERELLRRALDAWDRPASDKFSVIFEEIRTYLSNPSDDAEEPVEFKFIPTGKELLRYHPDEDCIETKVEFANYPAGSKFYPPKPAEPEAKPVLYIKEQELLYIQVLKQEGLAQEWKSNLGFVKEAGDVGLYLHPPKPAESEAETIETLKAENFKLASGQCTEGGPWGDQGGTPYCKYAARKPMTEEEIDEAIATNEHYCERSFAEGVRFAEKHHGIGGGDE